MSNLGPQQQNVSYDGILQIPGGVTAQLQQVQDGEGRGTGLFLSSAGTNATTADSFTVSDNGTSITGAVPRLISDGFGDYVSVKDFGAVGDGVTDDTAAIQSAFDYSVANGKTVFIPSGTYLFDRYYATGHVNLSIEGEAGDLPTLIPSQAVVDSGNYVIANPITRTFDVTGLALASNVKPNEQIISLVSVTGLQVGMVLQISSNRLWYNGNRGVYYCGEIHEIVDVNSVANTVTIADFTRDLYSTTETLVIRAWTPGCLSVKNLRIQAPYPATIVTSCGISIQQTLNSTFENVHLSGFESAALNETLCIGTQYQNIYISNSVDTNTATNNYGIESDGCLGAVVNGLYTNGLRRAFDAGAISGTSLAAPSRDWVVQNFNVVGGSAWYPVTAAISYGIGSHGPSENGVIRDGFIQDCRNGITARGRNTTVDGVTFSGSMYECVALYENGAGLIVTNCVFDSFNYPNKFASLSSVVAGSGTVDFVKLGLTTGGVDTNCFYDIPIVISNNVCKGLTNSFVQISQNTLVVKDLTITNNLAEGLPGTSGTCYLLYGYDVNTALNELVFNDNKLTAINGSALTLNETNLRIGYMAVNGDTVNCVIDSAYYVKIANNNYAKIPLHVVANKRLIMLVNAGPGGSGFFIVRVNNATLTAVGSGSALKPTNWVATAAGASLTGTTGAVGDVTFGLEPDASLYIENRQGYTIDFTFTAMS